MALASIPLVLDHDVRERLSAHDLLIVYKHSPTCGLCDIALEEVNAFVAENPDVPVWQVDVLAQRPLSQRLETLLDVQHESPQVILLRRGTPIWNASHRRVTRARLAEAIDSLA